MKKTSVACILASCLISAFAGLSFATNINDYPVGAAANGIGNSRHNMGSFGPVIHTNETTEVCVFCHTPHHASAAATDVPLWNRVNAATSYTAYGTTLSGTVISTVGSTSLACLSCHDGVTTWDTIVNAPGSDGVNPGGADQNWRFYMPSISAPLVPKIDHFSTATALDPVTLEGSCNQCHISAFQFKDNPAVRLTMGTNLKDDHPVSVTYNQSLPSLRPISTLINSVDLTTGLSPSAATVFTGNLSQNRWAIKGQISNTATIGDLLKNGKVECTSCHDPHFKNMSWDEVKARDAVNIDAISGAWVPFAWCTGESCTDGQFLRRVGGNTGSAVCRTCHTN